MGKGLITFDFIEYCPFKIEIHLINIHRVNTRLILLKAHAPYTVDLLSFISITVYAVDRVVFFV